MNNCNSIECGFNNGEGECERKDYNSCINRTIPKGDD